MQMIKLRTLGHYFRPMAALALPIAGQSLISFFVNLADNLMIGTLGDTAVSGVYMGTQIFTLLQWFVTGITTAMTILCAQFWGRRDVDAVRRVTSLALALGLPVAVLVMLAGLLFPARLIGLFTALPDVTEAGAVYLRLLAPSFPLFCASQILVAASRSVEYARPGLYASAGALVLNVSLNALLIFGLLGFSALGIAGAALATFAARALELAILVWLLFGRENPLGLTLRGLFRFDRMLMDTLLRCGTPVMLGEVVWGCNTVMRSYFMGRFSTQVITAFSMVNLLSETVFIWILALEAAAGILTGKLIGGRRWEELRPYARNMQVIFLLIGAAAVAVLLAVRPLFLSLYDVSAQARAAAWSLSGVTIPIVFFSVYEDMTLCGIVKCGGETTFVLKTDSILIFGVMLPACLIARHLGAAAETVCFLLQIDQILKCFVAAVKVNRFHWAHDLTTGDKKKSDIAKSEE